MSEEIEIMVDGAPFRARRGESLAMALSRRHPALRKSPKAGAPRGLFCGMGMCFECLLHVDGIERRACLTPVEPGMIVLTRVSGGTA